MESILLSIKKLLGIAEPYEEFDVDIIIHINSALAALEQLGVGKSGFFIASKNEKWSDFLQTDSETGLPNLQMAKSYVYMKVRLLFDPPTSSAVIEAYNKALAEYEWRAHIAVETPYFGGEAPVLE